MALGLLWYDNITQKRHGEAAHSPPTTEKADSVPEEAPQVKQQRLLVGEAMGVDGDSLMLGGEELRLHGIDAPEYHQTCTDADGEWDCGIRAAEELQKLLDDKRITCLVETTDGYGRTVATCNSDGTVINRRLVEDGWAMAYEHYSDRYLQAEKRAKRAGLGIWRGEVMKPWQWRRSDAV